MTTPSLPSAAANLADGDDATRSFGTPGLATTDSASAPMSSSSAADEPGAREAPAAFVERTLAFDAARPSFAGEHPAVFAGGLALLLIAAKSGPLARLLVAAAGAGLIARSLSGRDGLASLRDDRTAWSARAIESAGE